MEFGPRGRRLYEALLATDPSLETGPMHDVAVAACRAADTLWTLEWQAAHSEPAIWRGGSFVVNPKWSECRQQVLHFTALLTSLRLPDRRGQRAIKRPLRAPQKLG